MKSCLVTGAASGLGRALALRLASAGHQVLLTDQSVERLNSVVTKARALSPNCLGCRLDVREATEWSNAMQLVQSTWGSLDLLINCAGVLAVGDFWATPPSEAKSVVDVNLLGTIYGCQAAQGLLSLSGSGHIINVASCAGFLTFPWSSSYNASKAGVLAYSETLANELAESSIGVTIAVPGFFESSLMENAYCEDAVKQRCMGRVFERSKLTVDQVAEAILIGWTRRRFYVTVPWTVRLMWWHKRLWPARLMRSIQKTAQRLRNRYTANS